ncbi:Hypothetical protein SRAE_2000206800 [Strongyloides ratti]|uniref:Uncharacterized protein n=1 Tax=Strongyloides ratti TaxID=34506 RepID=A0A090MYL7_STRRB|nr:Hypothetical protein SRAE_2000206800 [Strongyloides ratti]CEF67404.1 Hypothetical protein SRAE_2000206800 [Strongyloides ratti]
MDYSMLYGNGMNYGGMFGGYNPYASMFGNYGGMNSPFFDYKNLYNSWPFYQNGMFNEGMNNMYSNGMMNSVNTNGLTSNNNMFGATMMSPEVVPNTRHVNFGSAGYRTTPLNKYQSLLKMKGTTTMNSDNCLLSMGCISNQWGQAKKKS